MKNVQLNGRNCSSDQGTWLASLSSSALHYWAKLRDSVLWLSDRGNLYPFSSLLFLFPILCFLLEKIDQKQNL